MATAASGTHPTGMHSFDLLCAGVVVLFDRTKKLSEMDCFKASLDYYLQHVPLHEFCVQFPQEVRASDVFLLVRIATILTYDKGDVPCQWKLAIPKHGGGKKRKTDKSVCLHFKK